MNAVLAHHRYVRYLALQLSALLRSTYPLPRKFVSFVMQVKFKAILDEI